MNYSGFHTDADLRLEAHLNELRAASAHAKEDLEIFLHSENPRKFSILAAYASEEDISEESLEKIQKVAKGEASAPAASMIGAEIKSRFEHIGEVRDDILNHDGKKTKIWQVNRIIDGTRGITGADPGTMYGRLVDDKVKHEAPGIWTSILIGLLQLVLVLLAPVTGGLTLIPAAAIICHRPGGMHHFREYERARRCCGGHRFRCAGVVVGGSFLFWLAVDIIGAVVDVGAAAAWRRIEGKLRELCIPLRHFGSGCRAAKPRRPPRKRPEILERVASEVGGEASRKARRPRCTYVPIERDATRVGRRNWCRGSKLFGARHGADGGERGHPRAMQEAWKASQAAPVKVSDSGAVMELRSSPCQLKATARTPTQDNLLSNNKAWETKVKDLENEAAKIPKGKAGAAGPPRRLQIAPRRSRRKCALLPSQANGSRHSSAQ